MDLTVYRASAFPHLNQGGNEAGIVLDADHLTADEMLRIAARVRFSETAFVLKSDSADFKLRYFSPLTEVPLCGHATIATFNLMRNLEIIKPGQFSIETQEGIFTINVYDDTVTMQLKTPTYGPEITKKTAATALGIDEDDLLDYPIQVVSTGIKEIFLGVKNLATLEALTIEPLTIQKFTDTHDASGLYVYTLDTKHDEADAHGRNFLPGLGIIEESATGTASGALACYLIKHAITVKESYIFEQGFILFKPSQIHVDITHKENIISDVYVGGGMRFLDKIYGFNYQQ